MEPTLDPLLSRLIKIFTPLPWFLSLLTLTISTNTTANRITKTVYEIVLDDRGRTLENAKRMSRLALSQINLDREMENAGRCGRCECEQSGESCAMASAVFHHAI